MSLSSIMSGNDEAPYSMPRSRVSSRASHTQPPYADAPKSPGLPVAQNNTPASPKVAVTPMSNGNSVKAETNGYAESLHRPDPDEVLAALEQIDSQSLRKVRIHDLERFATEYKLRGTKRVTTLFSEESKKRKVS
jgi:hypothetical protein